MAKFVPTIPHFFQPLLPGFEDHFSIPVLFCKKFLKGVEFDKATLRSSVSGGAEKKLWNVKINGRKFEDGWKEFVQTHDLRVGYFLVFEHVGNMVFDVLVFDLSACNKEYPISFYVKEEKIEIEEEEEEEEKIAEKSAPENPKQKNFKRKSFEVCTEAEHPNFVAKLRSTEGKRRVCVPAGFARLHNLRQRCCEMLLFDQENRSWRANLWFRKSDNQVFIARGWNKCRVVNGLEGGDYVIFQLIENGEMPVFKFSKKCVAEKQPMANLEMKASSVLEQPEELRKKQKLMKAKASSVLEHPEELKKEQKPLTTNLKAHNSSVPDHSCLEITVRSSRTPRSRVYIEEKFVKLHNLRSRSGEIILRDLKGRDWPAMLWNSSYGAFIHGWRKFHLANNLKRGQILSFEVTVMQKRTTFKLCSFNDSGKFTKKTQPDLGKNSKKRKPETTVRAKASSSVCGCPHFVANVTSTSVRQCKLYIPSKFSRLHNLNSTCEMVLMNQEGRTWLVKLWKKKLNEIYMCDWDVFRVANDLKPRDSFIFTLIENGKRPVLKMFRLNVKHEEAEGSSVRQPHLYFIMKASHFKSYRLVIPRKFSKHYGLIKSSKMILENENGRSWSVSLEQDTAGTLFMIGWADFAEANGIKVGSIFMLELVKRGFKPIMKFYGINQNIAACNKSYNNYKRESSSFKVEELFED